MTFRVWMPIAGLFLCVVIVFAILACTKVHARGLYAQSATSDWYKAQRNGKGGFCCDRADGHDYYGDYSFLPNGGVELEDGTVLPPYMVLTSHNPTGHAIWWYADNGITKVSYCFSPGPGD